MLCVVHSFTRSTSFVIFFFLAPLVTRGGFGTRIGHCLVFNVIIILNKKIYVVPSFVWGRETNNISKHMHMNLMTTYQLEKVKNQ